VGNLIADYFWLNEYMKINDNSTKFPIMLNRCWQ
jgi:hypothetical protein